MRSGDVTVHADPEAVGAGLVLAGRDKAWELVKQLPGLNARASPWLAHAAEDASTHAVIKLSGDRAGRMLVRREIQRLEGLPPSRHVVQLLDVCRDADAGTPWFAMPVAQSGSLAQAYGARRSRPLRELLGFALQIVHGLLVAEVVHRDLRPDNLLIYNGRGKAQLRIAGWERSIVHGAPQAQSLLLPPASDFAAPQAFMRDEDADIRDDLFSIGAIMWWGCTGGAPPIEAPGGMADGAADLPAQQLAARLGELYPAIPVPIAELTGRLLHAFRDDRSPPLDGRGHYLRWMRGGLERGIAEVLKAEARSGSLVAVGPASVARAARAKASPPQLPAGSRELPTDIDEPASPPSERREVAAGDTHKVAIEVKSRRRATNDARPARAPVPPAAEASPERERLLRRSTGSPTDTAGAADAARERWRRQRMEAASAAASHADAAHGLWRRQQLMWSSMVAAFAVEVAAGLLIFRPAGAFSGPLVMLGALMFAIAMGSLDALIATRSGIFVSATARGSKLSTSSLLATRVMVAVLVGVFAGQAVMVRILDTDLTALSASQQRPARARSNALHSSLLELDSRRAKARSAFESDAATLSGEAARLSSATKSDPATVSQTTEQRLQRVLESNAELLASHSVSEATLAAKRASIVDEIASANANLSESRKGRVQLLYRFLQQHSAAILLYVVVMLMIAAIQLMPSALAVLERRRPPTVAGVGAR